eukprot:6195688-Pleurochrysis_carterae.AAC.3
MSPMAVHGQGKASPPETDSVLNVGMNVVGVPTITDESDVAIRVGHAPHVSLAVWRVARGKERASVRVGQVSVPVDGTGVRLHPRALAVHGSCAFVKGGGRRCSELRSLCCVLCRDAFTLLVAVRMVESACANTNQVHSIGVEAAGTEQEK